jgi:hypothetical protein
MADRVSYGPITLFESDAYKQAKAMKTEEEALKLQKLRMDIAKGQEESDMSTAIGRASKAGDIAAFLEQEKQKDVGIPIGEQIGSRMVEKGGPGLLEATKMQGELDVEARVRQARRDAAMNFAAGEKSLLPTASIDMGGVKRTVLAPEAGAAGADIYGQVYRNQVPRLADTYIAEGYDRDTAVRMASADVRKELVKASTGGKIILSVGDAGTISYSNEEAERKWRDPQTPKAIKTQLNAIFGQSEQPAAANWIKTKLGR